ncbi:hypothetical protein OG21DRAFT_1518213 [Imleria badia]|nr:hypothetical protein OG21DRAFT_1518213 [Imleria badia]
MVAKDSKVATYLPRLTTKTMDGAHWPHIEFPDMFNAIMEEWLAGVGSKEEVSETDGAPQPKGDEGKHVVTDEL